MEELEEICEEYYRSLNKLRDWYNVYLKPKIEACITLEDLCDVWEDVEGFYDDLPQWLLDERKYTFNGLKNKIINEHEDKHRSNG